MCRSEFSRSKWRRFSLHISQDEDELSHSTNVVSHRSCPLGLTMLLRPLVTVFWVRRCALSSFGHHVSKDMGHDAKPSQGQAPPLLQTTGIDAIKRRAKFYQAKHFSVHLNKTGFNGCHFAAQTCSNSLQFTVYFTQVKICLIC